MYDVVIYVSWRFLQILWKKIVYLKIYTLFLLMIYRLFFSIIVSPILKGLRLLNQKNVRFSLAICNLITLQINARQLNKSTIYVLTRAQWRNASRAKRNEKIFWRTFSIKTIEMCEIEIPIKVSQRHIIPASTPSV